jgi:hypothetical protein
VKLLGVVAFVVSLGIAVGAGYATLGPGTRVPTWLGGAGDLDTIEAQVAELEAEVAGLEREAVLLQSDPFVIEKAIREDLRMAKRGEIVVRLSAASRTNSRLP